MKTVAPINETTKSKTFVSGSYHVIAANTAPLPKRTLEIFPKWRESMQT